jgi:hypothetical protein
MLATAFFACIGLTAHAGEGSQAFTCDLDFVPNAFPPYTAPAATIGFSGTGYSEMGLVCPEAVPLGVSVSDSDTIFIFCGGSCYEVGIPGVWSADWVTATIGAQGSPGGFITPAAQLDASMSDAPNVLFLPPKDLQPLETRNIRVVASIVNTCSQGFGDPVARISFFISVHRRQDKKYDVSFGGPLSFIPPLTKPPCLVVETVCELNQQLIPGDAPTVSISEFPDAGMVLGETRMIKSVAEDLDKLQAECGTPPGYDPVSSVFGEREFCDELDYVWSVVSSEGDGFFFQQGRSTLFQATKEGPITIDLTVLTADGEFASDQKTFEIFKPRVRVMSYDGGHPVYRDSTAVLYNKPHWRDSDGDGQATTPNGGGGDRRISAAYTKSSTGAPRHVVVDRVFVECGTPVPPSAIIRGDGPEAQDFSGCSCDDPDAADTELAFCDMTAEGALPNEVKKYDPYGITWEISFGNDNFVAAGDTDTWLYTVFKDPLSMLPKPFETLYDITCIASPGSADPSREQVRDSVWGAFSDLTVHRKERDGFNNPDDLQMAYWLNTETQCLDLAALLASPDGNGACGGWGQLLFASWAVQGVEGAVIHEVRPPQGNLFGFLLVQNWDRSDVAICAGDMGINQSRTDGRDETLFVYGNGLPNAPAVVPGADGTLETPPAGDDVVETTAFGPVLRSGENGLWESPAAPTDIVNPLFTLGAGLSHTTDAHPICIGTGPDMTLQSVPSGNDHIHHELGAIVPWPGYVWDLDGISAQGHMNNDPLSRFLNHHIVQLDTMWWDASYGVMKPTIEEYEDEVLWGWSADGVTAQEQTPAADADLIPHPNPL